MNSLMPTASASSAASASSGVSAAFAASGASASSAVSATSATGIATASESELTPLLTAWDLAHPSAADPDWRHLLDEIAHPHTTEAFHGLAATAV
ncbi:hypothetical protein [Streptomyces griseorubiginosus]|uniref:hypothetical protein n=1 Tax=Streptomyces griseorubiginosus TaxID=67304 RepID=UPI0033ECD978